MNNAWGYYQFGSFPTKFPTEFLSNSSYLIPGDLTIWSKARKYIDFSFANFHTSVVNGVLGQELYNN